jgi:glycosyltransferase involved in cell wall biosynthesis
MITILIPVYNGIEFINECIDSIKSQTYKHWEVIIGVNGHSKNSKVYSQAKKYEQENIKVFDLYTISGKSDALNEMIKYAKYDWISLLDVDDLWLPEKLECQAPYMNEYDVIGTNCIYFGEIEGVVPSIPYGDFSDSDFKKANPIINSSVLLKKELCWWDNNCVVEDYDLWMRLKQQHKKFLNVDKVMVRHRIHFNSAFNIKGNSNGVNKMLEKYN